MPREGMHIIDALRLHRMPTSCAITRILSRAQGYSTSTAGQRLFSVQSVREEHQMEEWVPHSLQVGAS